MAAAENSQEALIAKINDICAKQGVSSDELFQKLSTLDANDSVQNSDPAVKIFAPLTSSLTSLVAKIDASHQESERTKLNLPKQQQEFNKIVDLAEKKVDLNEAPSVSFAKKKLQYKTEQVMVGDTLTYRERRDTVLEMLTYFHTRLRSEKFNRLTKKEQKLFEHAQKKIEKGKFSGLNLQPSQNFLLTQAIGMLLQVVRSQMLICEALHSDALNTFKPEVLSLQANVAALKEVSDMLRLCYYKDDWKTMSVAKKEQYLADIVRTRPFSEESFAGGVTKTTPLADLKATVVESLLPKTNVSRKRDSPDETQPKKKTKFDHHSKNQKGVQDLQNRIKGMNKDQKTKFASKLGLSL